MSAIQPFYLLLNINHNRFSKEEYLFLEAELFARIYLAIKEYLGVQLKEYFHLMNFTKEMENEMLEANFLRLVINDIISTEEYTMEGVARYMDTHEDVVHEVISGRNSSPSVLLVQKALALHRSVRSDLYREIMKKVTSEHNPVS